MLEATSLADLQAKIAENPNVVVDFYGDRCGPCRQLAPKFQELAQEHKDDATFIKVNINGPGGQEIARQYGVSGVPDVQFFHGGETIDGTRLRGYRGKKPIEDNIQKMLQMETPKVSNEPQVHESDRDLADKLNELTLRAGPDGTARQGAITEKDIRELVKLCSDLDGHGVNEEYDLMNRFHDETKGRFDESAKKAMGLYFDLLHDRKGKGETVTDSDMKNLQAALEKQVVREQPKPPVTPPSATPTPAPTPNTPPAPPAKSASVGTENVPNPPEPTPAPPIEDLRVTPDPVKTPPAPPKVPAASEKSVSVYGIVGAHHVANWSGVSGEDKDYWASALAVEDSALKDGIESWHQQEGLTGNNVMVAWLKAAGDAYGKNMVKGITVTPEGVTVDFLDGKQVGVSTEELALARENANLKAADDSKSQAKAFNEIIYAAAAKRAQEEGHEGARTYDQALKALNDGDSMLSVARLLGLGDSRKESKESLLFERLSPEQLKKGGHDSVVAASSSQAVFANASQDGYVYDLYGKKSQFAEAKWAAALKPIHFRTIKPMEDMVVTPGN